MHLTPKVKLNYILLSMAIVAVLVVLNPFIAALNTEYLSRETFQSILAIAEFFAIVYLWKQFNNLRLTINQKELEDEALLKLEKDVEKATRSKN